ncbi:MAG TPA: peptidoglycan-binding domain-containing protein [Thermohalobaculum sp.]|nr:peptidoglycan-binding domain-containing protein [Thermohalobaculum sp.]
MDYASDIDLEGPEDRRRRGGGLSFLIVLIGTACLVAAWILSAGDPYGDLAHRVVEVRTPDAQPTGELEAAPVGPVGLLPDESPGEGPVGLLPDPAMPAPDGRTATAAEDEAFRQVIGSLPRAAGTHPAEIDRTAALRPVEVPAEGRASGPAAPPGSPPLTVPVEEFAEPPVEAAQAGAAGEVELTRAQRRSVQRRLGMAGHDSGGTDGVFGPMTREAISSYQEAAGLTVTGRMDRATLDALSAETDAEYVAWAESRRTGAASRSARVAAGGGEVPAAPGDCARDADGDIIGGGVGCSLRSLGDNLRDAFGGGQRGGAGFQPGADR